MAAGDHHGASDHHDRPGHHNRLGHDRSDDDGHNLPFDNHELVHDEPLVSRAGHELLKFWLAPQ